ncbi:AAA family ATPase [Nocardioides sp.]|uniref:AAA family ATPase n=1 Tax=Nocardioides sp. TaxID=35761 RepID=UPI003D1048D3
MRLHTLSATAFGPFADTVEVDFDTLSDAGLFLLCGATGAGKSSILDAVCFALYGEVPGDRSAARHLRCDTAAEGVAPEVFLDVTLGDRRFHLTRSPAWQRPKKRGTGTTTQQASVVVLELVDGTPRHLTSRLDEAGHLISGLLGMNLAQFTQVALLPQGRFQDFLRAKSEDRHTLLQKLFRTRRFEDVEHWLRDRRIALRRQSEAHTERIVGLLHRLDEVSNAFAFEIDDVALAAAAEGPWLTEGVQAAADAATHAVTEARQRLELTTELAVAADAELEAARLLASDQKRHTEAIQALLRLDQEQPRVEAQRERLAGARRAAPIHALHQQVQRVRGRLAAAEADRAATRTRAFELLDHELDDVELTDRLDQVRADLALARSMTAVETEVRELHDRRAVVHADRERCLQEIDQLRSQLQTLPALVAASVEQISAARAAGHDLPGAVALVDELERRRDARTRVIDLTAALGHARDVLRQSVDSHQHLREAWLQLQELRISGMAAELASGLAVGGTCPVCGSCDHPHPAVPSTDAPTASAEKAARKRADDADVVRQAHADHVRSLEKSLARAEEQAGTTPIDQLEKDLASAQSRAAQLQAQAQGRTDAEEVHRRAEDELLRVEAALGSARVAHGAADAALSSLEERIDRLTTSLAEVLDGHPDLTTFLESRARQETALKAAITATDTHRAAVAQLADVLDDLGREVDGCGFADPESAVAALLDESSIQELESAIARHEAARVSARAALEEPEIVAASKQPVADLAAVGQHHALAQDSRADAEAHHRRAIEVAGRVEALRTQVVDALAAWQPIRQDHALVSAVASFAEGKSPDNRAQMRLSAYVLSWRLGQVVAAANLRLARMTDQRYALEHTATRGAGETRGGLSLVIRDDWSGESRDPVTLSGGETFVVSLALALGLTDVVTQEAGGADIGTLFVDEGFGSLDADTLDDVMDTLDALREGGRVVGIVSHVPELRTRITAQLRVDKSRDGSTVHLVHADV